MQCGGDNFAVEPNRTEAHKQSEGDRSVTISLFDFPPVFYINDISSYVFECGLSTEMATAYVWLNITPKYGASHLERETVIISIQG